MKKNYVKPGLSIYSAMFSTNMLSGSGGPNPTSLGGQTMNAPAVDVTNADNNLSKGHSGTRVVW